MDEFINIITTNLKNEINNLITSTVAKESHRLQQAEYLKAKEAQKMLGLSEPTFNEFVRENNIPRHRLGERCYRYSKKDLIKAVEEL